MNNNKRIFFIRFQSWAHQPICEWVQWMNEWMNEWTKPGSSQGLQMIKYLTLLGHQQAVFITESHIFRAVSSDINDAKQPLLTWWYYYNEVVGGYVGFTLSVRPSVHPSCRVRFVAHCLYQGIYSYVALIQPMIVRCVAYHFQVNRSKVKVTQVVWIFSHIRSMARCVCLQEVAFRVT